MEFVELLLSDEALAVVVPIVVYWAYCGLHVTLGQSIYMHKYRLHPSTHEDSKNFVSKRQVISNVLKQQLVQLAMAAMVFKLTGGSRNNSSSSTKASSSPAQTATTTYCWWTTAASQIAVAMILFDLWHYAWHRTLHANRFLYRNLHSWHHRLVVPYAFGALYGHPLEGFVADTVGGMAAFLVSGMSPRASILFFSLCTVKAVDNHCGLALPAADYLLSGVWNSAAYHDVHHQLRGGQHNYSQLFFVVWDRVFGTYMPYVIEDRPDGGTLRVRAPGLDYRSKKNN
ncbi:hypothetical protein BS78_04G084400 [Paspalum vaginatum]|nr:hypothetical protein BS78_04G084400 [Paspalum vaginatum]